MKSAHYVWSKKHIKPHYIHSWYQRLAPSLTSWIGTGRPDLDPQAFWYQGPTQHRWADTPQQHPHPDAGRAPLANSTNCLAKCLLLL